MKPAKILARSGIVLLSAFCLLAFQLGTSALGPNGLAHAGQQFPTVVPVDPGFDEPFDESAPIATGFENYILIGDQAFPVGEEFLDASGIPLGPVIKDYFGWYGYATIEGHPDLRLIWYTDISGQKHHLIVSVTDPLFAGNPGVDNGDGFEDYVGQLIKAEDAAALSLGGIGSFAAGAVYAELAVCGPSAGAGCVAAVVTAVVGVVGAAISFVYHTIFKVLPAERNVVEQFDVIDEARP
ncbi:MAG: hypothetical protein IH858_13615 [Chloroflexi bacterium]|nr:hypothetical protein [Chloroflexota bacterium]